MRLRRLTGLEREKIEDEYKELLALIEDLKAILGQATSLPRCERAPQLC